jgi:hypothetical protein
MIKMIRMWTALAVLFILLVSFGLVFSTSADNSTNDSLANAEAISTGTEYSGTLTATSDEEDYYKMNIDSGKIIDISFTATSSSDMWLWFGDPSGSQIHEFPSKGGIEATYTYYLAAESTGGNYFVKLYYAEGGYSFQVDVSDQNDASSGGDVGTEIIDAYEIDSETLYSGELRDEDTIDMYKLSIDSANIINIIFTADSSSDMWIWMGDTSGDQVLEFSSKGGIMATEKYHTAYETEAGHWYFKVYYADGPYTFKIELTDQDDGGSGGDAPPEMVDAYEVDANIEYNGKLHDLDTVDYYKVWILKGASVGIKFTATTKGNMYIRVEDTEGDMVFEISSSGGVEDTQPTVSERPSGFWFVKVYYADGTYAFELTSSGGSNVTDDDITPDDDIVIDITTIEITINKIEITVEVDVNVTIEEVEISYIEGFLDGTLEELLKLQNLIDLDVYFQINPKEDDAEDIHIELDIEDNVPSDIKARNVKLFWLDEDKGEWVEVEDSEYDPDTGLLSADIDHLTVFAAYAKDETEDMEKDSAPGFEIILAILGSLLVLALVNRRRR